MLAAHKDHVRGIVSDAVNGVLVTASRDGTLAFWNFAKRSLLATLKTGHAIERIVLHRDTGLLAVVSTAIFRRVCVCVCVCVFK